MPEVSPYLHKVYTSDRVRVVSNKKYEIGLNIQKYQIVKLQYDIIYLPPIG